MDKNSRHYTLGYLKAFLVILEVLLVLYCVFTGLIFATLVPVHGQITSVGNRSRAIHERTRYGYYTFKNAVPRIDYEYTTRHQRYWSHRISPLVAFATPKYELGQATVYYSRLNPAYSSLEGFDWIWYLGNNVPLVINSVFLWLIQVGKSRRKSLKN